MPIQVARLAVHQVLDMPVERLSAVIGTWPEPALLESGPGFGEAGRWSILAAHPRLVWEATDSRWSVRTDNGAAERGEGDVLAVLDALLRRYSLAGPAEERDPAIPPFQGGMIGFVGYDLAPRIERLPRRLPRDSRLPDIRMALYDTAVTVDVHSGKAELWAWDLTDEGREAPVKRSRAWRRGARTRLLSPVSQAEPIRAGRLGRLTCSFDREAYLATVRRVLEYIAAGDVFQVNLSQRFTGRGRPEPLDVYLKLRSQSPAPFGAFLQWDDLAVVSASPESFFRTQGRPAGHPADQGNSAARPHAGRRCQARRRALRLGQRPRRADHDRRPRTQRPGPRLPVRLGAGPRPLDGRVVRAGPPPGGHGRRQAATRSRPGRRPAGGLPRRLDHRRTEDPRDGNHRRARADPPQPLHRRRSATSAEVATARSTSQSARSSSKGTARASRSEAESWLILIPKRNTRRRLPRAEGCVPSSIRGTGSRRRMIWVRGGILPDLALRVSALDRVFEHGLGLFETFRTWNGHPTLLDRHLERMRRSAGELGLALDHRQVPDHRAILELIAANPLSLGAGEDVRAAAHPLRRPGDHAALGVGPLDDRGPLPPPSA